MSICYKRLVLAVFSRIRQTPSFRTRRHFSSTQIKHFPYLCFPSFVDDDNRHSHVFFLSLLMPLDHAQKNKSALTCTIRQARRSTRSALHCQFRYQKTTASTRQICLVLARFVTNKKREGKLLSRFFVCLDHRFL